MKEGCSGKKDPSTIAMHLSYWSNCSIFVSSESQVVKSCWGAVMLMPLLLMLTGLEEMISYSLHHLFCNSASTLSLKVTCGCALIRTCLFCSLVCWCIFGSLSWIIWMNLLLPERNAINDLYLLLIWVHCNGRKSDPSLLLMQDTKLFQQWIFFLRSTENSQLIVLT